ncbi:N-alpha-acetyltransferase 60 isoform X2 [Oratosquilla oratoria]|uniref:N-alpha-acetyltransferase 60 isoform X2 n=1 Tax=Oratosquilla oratoria TaxID=337810 RepID=UPI003F76E0B9
MVKRLCKQWFPIEYPDVWYEDITANPRFYALAATFQNKIVGLLVAETKPLTKMNKEDQDLLTGQGEVGYILSLGVSKDHRRNGVASLLLDNYLNLLTTHQVSAVKAVLLHVLTSNEAAIKFYEKRNFSRHAFLPYYYNIKGRPKDGFSYVRYINGGHAPWSLLDYMHHFATSWYIVEVCSWPLRVACKLWCFLAHAATAVMTHRCS